MNKLKSMAKKTGKSALMAKDVVEKVRAGRYEMKNLVQCVRAGSLRALK